MRIIQRLLRLDESDRRRWNGGAVDVLYIAWRVPCRRSSHVGTGDGWSGRWRTSWLVANGHEWWYKLYMAASQTQGREMMVNSVGCRRGCRWVGHVLGGAREMVSCDAVAP